MAAEVQDFYQNMCKGLNALNPSYSFQFEEHPESDGQQTLRLSTPENLVALMSFLKHQCGFRFLMDLCGVDYPQANPRFEVVYHLFNDTLGRRLRVRVPVADGAPVPTVSGIWRGANWFEREAWDMMGIPFGGHPYLKRILCHEQFEGHPLRKDYPADKNQSSTRQLEHVFASRQKELEKKHGEDLLYINIGPAHPATHGTLRFMAVVDGAETIKEIDCEIGYLHRCFEKMCETHNYNQIIPYTDRLNYCSAPMNNSCFAATIEKFFQLTLPPRATMIRMILDEFSRIIDHLVCIGANAVDMGALTNFWYFFQERENVYALFEKLCGARLTVSLTRIGGMGFDLPEGWVSQARSVLDSIEKSHAEVHGLLTDNRIFVQRMKGSGAVSAEVAIDYGFTGPCLRATGVPHDLRKSHPYYFYKDVDFDIPVGSAGDSYDRYLVRMEEILQSVRILRWCFDNLPEGPIVVPDKNIALPNKKDVYGNIEGLMNHFMLVIHGCQPPAGEMYHAHEAANGELGFYVISDGSGKPHRVKCRPPCFAILSGFPEMVKGGRISDAIATLSSINVIAGELDR